MLAARPSDPILQIALPLVAGWYWHPAWYTALHIGVGRAAPQTGGVSNNPVPRLA
jgi:hypothetical protein